MTSQKRGLPILNEERAIGEKLPQLAVPLLVVQLLGAKGGQSDDTVVEVAVPLTQAAL